MGQKLNPYGRKPQHRLGIESISYIKTFCREDLHDGFATDKRMPQYFVDTICIPTAGENDRK